MSITPQSTCYLSITALVLLGLICPQSVQANDWPVPLNGMVADMVAKRKDVLDCGGFFGKPPNRNIYAHPLRPESHDLPPRLVSRINRDIATGINKAITAQKACLDVIAGAETGADAAWQINHALTATSYADFIAAMPKADYVLVPEVDVNGYEVSLRARVIEIDKTGKWMRNMAATTAPIIYKVPSDLQGKARPLGTAMDSLARRLYQQLDASKLPNLRGGNFTFSTIARANGQPVPAEIQARVTDRLREALAKQDQTRILNQTSDKRMGLSLRLSLPNDEIALLAVEAYDADTQTSPFTLTSAITCQSFQQGCLALRKGDGESITALASSPLAKEAQAISKTQIQTARLVSARAGIIRYALTRDNTGLNRHLPAERDILADYAAFEHALPYAESGKTAPSHMHKDRINTSLTAKVMPLPVLDEPLFEITARPSAFIDGGEPAQLRGTAKQAIATVMLGMDAADGVIAMTSNPIRIDANKPLEFMAKVDGKDQKVALGFPDVYPDSCLLTPPQAGQSVNALMLIAVPWKDRARLANLLPETLISGRSFIQPTPFPQAMDRLVTRLDGLGRVQIKLAAFETRVHDAADCPK